MHWFRAHPFANLFALAGLVLLLIMGAATQRQATLAEGPFITLSAGNIPSTVTVTTPNNAYSAPTAESANNSGGSTYVPFSIPRPQTATSSSAAPESAYDPALSILASLSHDQSSTPPPDTSASNALLQLAQSFTIGGLGVNTAAQTQSRTPEQQALYAYGNQAGLVVLSFENANPDMGQTLQNWLDHRADSSQQAQIRAIAADMTTAGSALSALAAVPQPAAAANAQLAAGFTTAATQLQAVVSASGSDGTLVESMKTYDTAVDQYTKSYLAVADVFALHEVTFAANDPGSVFSMPH